MKRITAGFITILSTAALVACGGGDDDGAGPDARVLVVPDANPLQPDAAVSACGVTADYTESNEAGNVVADVGTPETTPTFTSGTSFTIGGCIDPLQANESEIDSDSYYITVGGTDPVMLRFELTSAGAAALPNLRMYLVVEDAGQYSLIDAGSWSSTVGGGLIGRAVVGPGTYELWVWSDLPQSGGLPTNVTEYVVNVTEYTKVCPPATPGPTWTEQESGDPLVNQTVIITYDSNGSVRQAGAGSPEDTGYTVDKDGHIGIAGVSEAVVGDANGYSDADTFKFTTGANVTELHVALNWGDTPPTDMDFYLFNAGDTAGNTIVAAGTLISNVDEIQVINVAPSTDYWLWVATYVDPPIGGTAKPYTVDMCAGETFPAP